MTERLWGRWWPEPADTEPIDSGSHLEWWPSHRAAEQALRERLGAQPATIDGIARSTQNLADGRTLADAQFYGDRRSRIYLYAVTGRPGHGPRPESAPYGMLEFGPRGGIRFRNLAGVESDTVRVQVVHQESGQELYLRDVVVYPWSIASFGRSTNPNRWARWLKHVARDGLARTLDIAVPGPHLATATDLDTGHQIASLVLDPELEAVR
ncbi:hypothetical protein OG618_37015 (plasmid) [Kitasatospora sp. NBC_01246]|uniref:hypothetical protein n=1 Tax=Kitasatospora sp. NBC_01246 TaxID=2903570 RepID=UPI002E370727|nr:hypothetical protein [Kitasatospora sp. NBC_01246]